MTTLTSGAASGARIARRLAQMVGKGKYDRWFAASELTIRDGELGVHVPNKFVADFIDHHFHDQMLSVAEAELGEGASVNIRVDTPATRTAQARSRAPQRRDNGAPASRTPRPAATVENAAATDTSRSRRPAPVSQPVEPLRHSLADFVVGPSNELAYRAAARLAEEPDYRLNPLFIYGPCGQGKTHLLQGLCRRYTQVNTTGRWSYMTAERFTNQFVASIHNNKREALRRQMRRLDLLVIDDAHFLSGKTATQNEFLHTIEALRLSGAKLVLAANAHPKRLGTVSDALVSRFLSGMVVAIGEPDTDTCRSILQALSRRRGLILAEGVAERLADHCRGSAREAEGMVNKLAALVNLRHGGGVAASMRPVGHALVNELLGIDNTGDPRRPVRLEQIVQTVCDELGVSRSELMGKSRHRRIVVARSLAVHLARQLTNMSFPELARALERPNHSTVVTAAQRIKRQIEKREPLPLSISDRQQRIDELAEQLRRQLVGNSPDADDD